MDKKPTYDELAAHVERLREYLKFIARDYSVGHAEYLHPYYVAETALNESPPQSLNHIQAQVEEETIERCKIRGRIAQLENKVVDIEIDTIERKYSNQPETAAKDGE